MNRGVKVLQTFALPLGYGTVIALKTRKKNVKGFQKRYPLVFINRSELIRSSLIQFIILY